MKKKKLTVNIKNTENVFDSHQITSSLPLVMVQRRPCFSFSPLVCVSQEAYQAQQVIKLPRPQGGAMIQNKLLNFFFKLHTI